MGPALFCFIEIHNTVLLVKPFEIMTAMNYSSIIKESAGAKENTPMKTTSLAAPLLLLFCLQVNVPIGQINQGKLPIGQINQSKLPIGQNNQGIRSYWSNKSR